MEMPLDGHAVYGRMKNLSIPHDDDRQIVVQETLRLQSALQSALQPSSPEGLFVE